ncbi:unnamed protein product [Durusdinium trenchii]|uniref:Uncharacterized protein n=2 Tax=Durusdinium trenchii TaxID=1381693 RepID=A0ABP0L6T1_9DINO
MPSAKCPTHEDPEEALLLQHTPPLPAARSTTSTSRNRESNAARANAATCASVSFGATLLAILAVAMWNNHLEGELDDQDVETFYKFGQVQDLLHWQSTVMDVCDYSSETDEQVVQLAAAQTSPKGDICSSKVLAHPYPCNWTEQWHCPAWKMGAGHDCQDDGGIGFYCCCEVSRPRTMTWGRSPFTETLPTPQSQIARIKVVSYNLEWWKIYNTMKGNGGSEGGVIAATHAAEPVDLIAFQECGDKDRVLADAGLLDSFTTFGAPHQKCAAVRKAAWRFISKGHEDIAADVYWNFFGKRGVMWTRLWHVSSGLRVFFANFHGPLAINSGGCCGGKRTARNLLRVIEQNSEPGDVIILLGDFNANSASHTVKELRKSLVHVQSGHVLGGIDHAFVNLPPSTVKAMQDIGSGGSDHHAVMTVFEIDTADPGQWTNLEQNSQLSEAIIGELHADFPKDDWNDFWCGLEEFGASYNPVGGESAGWEVEDHVPTTDWCCRWCQRDLQCKAFRFEGISGSNQTRCTLMSAYERGAHNSSYLTVSSGLPASVAIEELRKSFVDSHVRLYR